MKYRIILILFIIFLFTILYNISVAEEKWMTISTKEGLPNKFIKDLRSDSENVYIATANGFAIYTIKNKKMKIITKKEGLTDNYINAIELDKDYVWLATDNGLNRYDKRTEKIISYTKQDGLVDNAVSAILVDGDYIWVGTTYWGISRYDRSVNKWEKFSIIDGLVDNSITCFALDSGYIWIGTKNGLSYYDKVTGMLSGYDTTQGLSDGNIKAIQVSGQYIWLGTANGLIRFDKYEENFKTYTTTDGLADDFIQCLSSGGSYLWIGTFSGVTRYDQIQGTWFTYTIKDGLVENSVSALDVNGNYLWLGTDGGGISRFDKVYPQAVISPFSFYSEKGKITILGTAFSYNDISGYKLEFKNDAMKSYLSSDIKLESKNNVFDGKLAEWDVSKLLNINYDVRLTIVDKNNVKNVTVGSFIVDTKPPQITLDPLPEAVKNPSAFIKGTYIDDNIREVIITVNKKSKEKAELNRVLKKYSKEIQINSGVNELTITAYDIASQSSTISTKIVYDKEKPVITLDPYPKRTKERELTIRGTVKDSGIQKIILNPGNLDIPFTEAGPGEFAFEQKIKLEPGLNKFEIATYDFVGNKVTDSIISEFIGSGLFISLNKDILKVTDPAYTVKGVYNSENIKNINIEPFNENALIDAKAKSFTLKVKLKEGANDIVANIIDKDNNKNFDMITVFYTTEKSKLDLAKIPEFSSLQIANIEGNYSEPNLDRIFIDPGNIPAGIDKEKNMFFAKLNLNRSTNRFELNMLDKFGVKTQKKFKIIYDPEAPALALEKIPETVYTPQLTVRGTYKEENISKVMVLPDNIACTLDPGRQSFSAVLKLKEGKNNFQIKAVDKAQNVSSIDQTVICHSGNTVASSGTAEQADSEYIKQLKAEIERLKALLRDRPAGPAVESVFQLPQASGLVIVPYARLKVNSFLDISRKYLGSINHLDFISRYNSIQSADRENMVLIPTKSFIRNYSSINDSSLRKIVDLIAISYRYSYDSADKFKRRFGLYLLNNQYINQNDFNQLLASGQISLLNTRIGINKKINNTGLPAINISFQNNFMGIEFLNGRLYSQK